MIQLQKLNSYISKSIILLKYVKTISMGIICYTCSLFISLLSSTIMKDISGYTLQYVCLNN